MKTSSKSKISRYEFKDQIGKGNFATVWKAIDNKNFTFVAIKAIESSQIEAQPKVLELLQSEINILKEIDHPNVVKLYDSFEEKGKYYLIMEYCNGGDLEKYVKAKKDKCLSEEEVLVFFKQLLNGFKALHSVRAMHRDFKLANVLMNDGLLKIADLGFSKQADLARTALGTGVYMAPEIMKYQRYNNKVDIWSLAICIYEMLFGKCPFFGRTENELLIEVEKNVLNFNVNGHKISEEFQSLIRKMLVVDPEKRINWIEIYKSPLLNNNKASATLYLSRGEVEAQHQNVLFQKNKDFYENKKNLDYDNMAMTKERNERKRTPLKRPNSDSEEDEQTILSKKVIQKAKEITPKKNRPRDSDSDEDEISLKNKREATKKSQKEKPKEEEDEEMTLKIKRGNNKIKKAEEDTLKKEKKKVVDSDDSDISDDRKKEMTILSKRKEKVEKEEEDPKNKEKTKLKNKANKEKSPMSKGSEEEITMERPKYKKKEIVIDDDDKEKKKKKKMQEKKQMKSSDDEENENTLVKNKYGKKSPENQKKVSKNKEKSSSSDSNVDEMTRDNRLIKKKEEKKIENLEKKDENDKKKVLKNSSNDEQEEQTLERKRVLQKKDEKKETLKKKLDSDEEEKSTRVKQNLNTRLKEKNDAFTILEKKYLHRRNIISHHAKILEGGIKLSLNFNAIYTYFILSKRLQMLALDFSKKLEEKENIFEGKYFLDFVSSRAYYTIFDVFNQQKDIYSTYLKQLKEQIEKYDTYNNPLFETLKELFSQNDSDVSNLMFKQADQLFIQVLMDFSYTASDTISAWKWEKHNESKEKAKKYALHIIELVDCCLYLESFPFDETAEAGFNFRLYEEDLEKLELEDLVKNLEKRKEILLLKI